MSDKVNPNIKTKLISCKIADCWDNSNFTLEVNNEKHHVWENMIQGHWAPEGSYYYEVIPGKPPQKKILWENCEKKRESSDMSQGYQLTRIKHIIGVAAVIAKILEGKEIKEIGKYVTAFVNEDRNMEAIVYPYLDLDWEIAKNHNEAYRECKLFMCDVINELQEHGFVQKENGRWIQNKPETEDKT